MGTVKTVGAAVIQVALAAGFVGLGGLGAVLIVMAVGFPGPALQRIAVLILGVGGITIAVGFVQILRRRPRKQPT